MTDVKEDLSPGQKVELLVNVFSGKNICPLLDTFNAKQLVEAHTLMWDKLVEIFYYTQDGDFNRENVTKKMTPSAVYQKQQGCDLRLDYCKGVECVWSNPECAGNKIKDHIQVMAKELHGYLESCYQKEAADLPEKTHREGETSAFLLNRS